MDLEAYLLYAMTVPARPMPLLFYFFVAFIMYCVNEMRKAMTVLLVGRWLIPCHLGRMYLSFSLIFMFEVKTVRRRKNAEPLRTFVGGYRGYSTELSGNQEDIFFLKLL